MVPALMRIYHDDMAHVGQTKTYEGMTPNYWFPSMRKKISHYVNNCFTCIMSNDSINRLKGETSLYPAPKVPLEILHIDHFGPLQETRDRFKHILVIVDAFTRFTWLCPVQTTSTKEVVKNLKSIVNYFRTVLLKKRDFCRGI